MFGDHLGSLWIYLEDSEGHHVVFQVFGDQGQQWNHQEIDLVLNSGQSKVRCQNRFGLIEIYLNLLLQLVIMPMLNLRIICSFAFARLCLRQ